MAEPIEAVLANLEGVKRSGEGWAARCPAHDDRHASLSVGVGADRRVLLDCHAGCGAEAVVERLGLTMAELFVPRQNGTAPKPIRRSIIRYDAIDRDGEIVATHVRSNLSDGSKAFWWERPHLGRGLGGLKLEDLPLYGLPALLAATEDAVVLLVEGEKPRDALEKHRILSVGTMTGAAGTPSAESLRPLGGHRVILWPDNDQVGREHMERIAGRLQGIARSVQFIHWTGAPPKGDAADYFALHDSPGNLPSLVVDMLPGLPTANGEREQVAGRGLLDLVRMSTVTPEEVHWLWLGRIPLGKLTVLMGDPGLGKSLLTIYCSAILTTAGAWPDGEKAERGPVVILTAEDGLADTVRPRLDAAGADVEIVYALRSIREKEEDEVGRLFRLGSDVLLLEEAIRAAGAKLVILDPLNAYLGGVDSHKAAEVRAVLAPLAALAERTGVAIVVIHHLNKGTSANALYRAGGSLDFVAAARSVLGVVPDPNEPGRCLLLSVKVNIAERPAGLGYRVKASGLSSKSPPIIEWDEEAVTVDPVTAFASNELPEERGARSELKEFLAELLKDGPVAATVTKRAIRDSLGGASEATMARARREIGVKVRKIGYGTSGQWTWELPEEAESKNPALEKTEGFEVFEAIEALDAPIDSKASKTSMTSNPSYKSSARAHEESSPAGGAPDIRDPKTGRRLSSPFEMDPDEAERQFPL